MATKGKAAKGRGTFLHDTVGHPHLDTMHNELKIAHHLFLCTVSHIISSLRPPNWLVDAALGSSKHVLSIPIASMNKIELQRCALSMQCPNKLAKSMLLSLLGAQRSGIRTAIVATTAESARRRCVGKLLARAVHSDSNHEQIELERCALIMQCPNSIGKAQKSMCNVR